MINNTINYNACLPQYAIQLLIGSLGDEHVQKGDWATSKGDWIIG